MAMGLAIISDSKRILRMETLSADVGDFTVQNQP
jgi:hypothetical protein